MRIILGDGRSISFWDNKWIGVETLGVQFPELRNVASDPGATITDNLIREEACYHWEVRCRRNLTNEEAYRYQEMMLGLHNAAAHFEEMDRTRWGNNGNYPVRSFYTILAKEKANKVVKPEDIDNNFPMKKIWDR